MKVLALAFLFFLGLAAFTSAGEMPSRQCAITLAAPDTLEDPNEERACPPFTPFQAIGTDDYDAVRSNAGQAGVPIDVWNRCRYVDNFDFDKPLFVPFKSELEWDAFISGYPYFMSLETCARPEPKTILPSAACLDPSPASYTVNLPYARTGVVKTENRSFTCAPPEEGCPSWTQTAQVTYTALNADVANPTWGAGGVTYGGSTPDPETCTIAGACGSAHGAAVVSSPTSSLCDAGDPSAVSGSGPWTWTCAGANGGGDASCTAPISAQAGVCGPANGVEVSEAPSSNLCTTGTASAVGGTGPWTWTCAGIGSGADANCNAPATPPAVCYSNTWTPRASNRRWGSITSSADGTKLAATVISGRLYTSTDSGATWTARESDREWTDIVGSADGTKLAATPDGSQIYTSTDSGATWTARESNRRWFGIDNSADGTKLAAVVYGGGQIYTSTDSGATWTARATNRDWRDITSSADGTKLAAVGTGAQIYTSTDSGATWTARASSRDWFDIDGSADGTKLAATVNGGRIYTSTDSGATWTARESNRSWTDIASSADGTKLAAVAWGGQIYTSTDSGATWTACESNRNWSTIDISADGTKFVAAVMDGQIYTSGCLCGGGGED